MTTHSYSSNLTGAVIKTGSEQSIRDTSRRIPYEAPYLAATVFRTLTFLDYPWSVCSPSLLTNERLPYYDLACYRSFPGGDLGAQVIPHFAVGDGWTTQILLINQRTPADGTMQFWTRIRQHRAPHNQFDGASSTVAYTMPGEKFAKACRTPAASDLPTELARIIRELGRRPPLVIFGTNRDRSRCLKRVPVITGTAFRSTSRHRLRR